MITKPKRIVDRDLLDSYHDKSCVICGSTIGVVGHHLKTRGAGGDDVAENLIAVCGKHHDEIHRIGTYTWKVKYGK